MMFKHKRIQRLLKLGCIGTVRCLLDKFFLKILSKFFKFNSWHASAPCSCRPYKFEIVSIANSLNPVTVLEVGCGLGDIISRINARNRYGIDCDENVINAANFLSSIRGVHYIVADINDDEIISMKILDDVDLLILVNWPHGVPWDELSSAVMNVINTLNVSSILIDGIHLDTPGYANYYSKNDFEKWGHVIDVIPLSDGIRSLYQISVV